MKAHPLRAPLGPVSVDHFLRHHWQRRPLLIRQALPGIEPALSPEQLIALARRDDVESRLIAGRGARWHLAHGPFEPGDLPPLNRKRWTLLVQGLDLHLEAAHALLARFRFLPDARLDDLMISLATDQGGVGPHIDSYDVFLVQVWGRRRWRIAPPGETRLKPGLPLKILQTFEPTEEWVLEPGDILYLPPGWGHDGVAQGPCMTCSVGLRAPSRQEFLRAFLAESADDPQGADPRFSDPGRAPSAHPGALPEDLHGRLRDWALDWRPDPRTVDRFIGRFLTEPKANVWFDPPVRADGLARFTRKAARHGLRLDRRSRMLYRRRQVFLNGEVFTVPRAAHLWLRRLADDRRLPAAACAQALAEPELAALLHDWWCAGWLTQDTSIQSKPRT